MTRCGFVALVGPPNSGKSTLLNALTRSRLSIVTHKAQTTRGRLRGIVVEGDAQLIFIDTPGLCKPIGLLETAMLDAAWRSVAEADLCILAIDAARRDEKAMRRVGELFAARPKPPRLWLLLNKIDLTPRPALLSSIAAYDAMGEATGGFEEIFPISAATGEGVAAFRAHCAAAAPPGPWHYPADALTDRPLRALAADITREKTLLHLHDEIPYDLTVETESWEEAPSGEIRIDQIVYCRRDAHKAIILGAGGRTLRRIGVAARRDIMTLIGKKAHLFLFVKTDENWPLRRERYEAMGLEAPPGLKAAKQRKNAKGRSKKPPSRRRASAARPGSTRRG